MRIAAALLALGLFSCVTQKPTAYKVDKETGTDCVNHCGELGMHMSAVVIIANMAGCVCEPGSGRSATGGSAAASGGAVAAMISAQQAQQQQVHSPTH